MSSTPPAHYTEIQDPTRELGAAAVKKKRNVDALVSDELISRGWTFSGSLDGLLWCVSCKQPTVWRDQHGRPKHHHCAEDLI